MPLGKLRDRAGILSVARSESDETEVTLAAKAAREALANASASAKDLSWVIATSETHHQFPSLAAQLHREIGAAERCGALDVGGACLGFLHALAVAKAFVVAGAALVLVVTADVHSRTLTAGRVAGEFGGLFGDGASAFLVQREIAGGDAASPGTFLMEDFFFGCASQYQSAIEVAAQPEDRLHVVFEGEALSRAATARLEQCIGELESRSSVPRTQVAAFATHQPNPRLVALLAKKASVAIDRFPMIADLRGNLGSTTCAAALHAALRSAREAVSKSAPIFLASLGPGLLFGGGWLAPVENTSLG